MVAVPGRGPCREAVRLLASEAGLRVLLGGGSDRGAVLLDIGRLTEDIEPLLEAADRFVLVARGGVEPLTHVSTYGLDAGAYAGRLTLAVVGPCPYPTEEIEKTLAIERVHFLPWDSKSVAAMNSLHRDVWRTTGLRRPPLVTAVQKLARMLAEPSESEIRTAEAYGNRTTEGHQTGPGGGSRAGLVQVPGVEESGSWVVR
ncbi:hypothetical protein ACWCOZ_18615 [Streptomyces sp. NPDC001840]